MQNIQTHRYRFNILYDGHQEQHMFNKVGIDDPTFTHVKADMTSNVIWSSKAPDTH